MYACMWMYAIRMFVHNQYFDLKVQPSNFIADVGSKTLELTTAKSMPSLPYRLENHGPKVIVSKILYFEYDYL